MERERSQGTARWTRQRPGSPWRSDTEYPVSVEMKYTSFPAFPAGNSGPGRILPGRFLGQRPKLPEAK